MSDNPSRSVPRVLLSGLAAGVVLGAPIAAVAAAGAEETSAAAVERVASAADCPAVDSAEMTAAAIRAQFRASFTAGVVAQAADDPIQVIC